MSVILTGAGAVAKLLGGVGCRTVFAYPGTSELELRAAVAERDGMRLINARGDREAVFMAAGGNLVGPASCAAILHGARGLTNALGAVADVRRSEATGLCLVGMPSRASAGFLPSHGEPDLIEAVGAFALRAVDVLIMKGLDPDRFIDLVTQALAALGEVCRGPVLLGLPHDVLTARFVPSDVVNQSEPVAWRRRYPDVRAALALLGAAERPVFLVDDYLLRWPGADRLLGRLAARLGAPVLQVAYRRGPMLFERLQRDAVPTFLGPYDPADRGHREVVASADLLVTVEDRNMYPRVVGELPGCPKVAVTSNGPATAKNGYLRPSDALVVGDVGLALAAVVEGLGPPEHADPGEGSGNGAGSGVPRGGVPAADMFARGLAGGLQAIEPLRLVDDSQMLGGLLARNYECLPASVRVFASHGGFVGGGLATAAGLATAHPGSQVVVLLGDQGFTNGVQALAAIRELQVPLLMVVCNNGSSVSLGLQADADGVSDGVRGLLGNVPGWATRRSPEASVWLRARSCGPIRHRPVTCRSGSRPQSRRRSPTGVHTSWS